MYDQSIEVLFIGESSRVGAVLLTLSVEKISRLKGIAVCYLSSYRCMASLSDMVTSYAILNRSEYASSSKAVCRG